MSKPSIGRPATRCVGESRVTRSGCSGFEPLELVQEVVELLVGDLGIVVDVVPLFVMANQRREAVRMRLSGDAA